jgi:glycosyltransferase involved in cell wall biosynthesis
MQSKKIIYFSTYDDVKNPHYGGGGAIAVHEIAKRLSKKYDIHVFSWDYSNKKKEIIEGVSYERFGSSSLSPKLAMFVYQICLPFIVSNKKFDLWMESFCPPFTTAFLPLFIKNPVVGIVHMLAATDMERKYKLPFHLIQDLGIKTYKHFIVTSEAVKKKVEKINPHSSLAVISNGINQVQKPTVKKQKYILFLGRIEVDQKGIDLLLGAFKKFHIQNNTYQLVIAGDGDPREVIKVTELVKNLDLKKSVILKGKVSGKVKEELYKYAACVVVSSRFETYSLVALEAMSHGAPLVCFAIEGLQWITEKTAIKVKPFDTAQLAKAIEKVVTNTKYSQNMIKAGNNYAKQFTWDSLAKQYDEYIVSLKI